MKKTSKALLLSLCAVVLVTASVLGTMAYLTDETDDVVNTFTVGNVTLGEEGVQEGLDEAKVDEYGNPVVPAERTNANKYKLVPGQTYAKDPTVYVNNESEDSYIFVKVENDLGELEADTETAPGGYTDIADQIIANGWIALDGYTGIYYKEFTQAIADEGDYTDMVVFEEFKLVDNANTLDSWDTIEDEDQDITITAYAVQKEGFDTAEAAWEAAFSASNSN